MNTSKMKSLVGSLLLLASMNVMATHEHDATSNGSNSGSYETGAFNFTENSDQNVTSEISGSATVHGDSSANVAGNQYNCSVAGACGDAPIADAVGGTYYDSGPGASNYGEYKEVQVLSFSYVEIFKPVAATQVDVDIALELDSESTLTIGDMIVGTESLGYQKVADLDSDGNQLYKLTPVWSGLNALDASMRSSDNSLEAQRIASNSTQTVITTPSMGAPSINASNADMCRAGISGAVSTLGLGVSAGITLVDKNCERLKAARLLYNLGLMDVALALLGQDERIAAAMRQADPVRYAPYLDVRTEIDVEDNSASAETKANGGEVDHQDPQANQEKVDGGKSLLGTLFGFN